MEPTEAAASELSYEQRAGAALRQARKRRGFSARGLAARLGWDHSELCRIEKGQPTSLARYGAIARQLGMTLVFRFKTDRESRAA